jgi:hypothetical protein
MAGGLTSGIGPAGYAAAGLLILAGLLLFTRRAFAFYVALAAAVATLASGILGLLGRTSLSLPFPPPLTIGVGVYLTLRLFLARASLGPRRPPSSQSPAEGGP